MTFTEYRQKGFTKHLIPVHINKMRCDIYYWRWSSDIGDWIRGEKISEKMKKMYKTPFVKPTFKEKQFYYQQLIVNTTGINIVNCGNCSTVILHKVDKIKLKCFNCGMKSDICDFPDLNYL